MALALAYFAITLAQPGVHSFAKAGAIAEAAQSAHAMHVTSGAEHKHHGGGSRHAHVGSAATADVSDPLCDVQCAPASVMPVDGLGLCDVVARCYATSDFVKLADSEPLGLIRPPRSLV